MLVPPLSVMPEVPGPEVVRSRAPVRFSLADFFRIRQPAGSIV
jgi:hypothetical protein